MDVQVKSRKNRFSEKLKSFYFPALSVMLSFVSVHAGFTFYEAFFGIVVAVLASFVFETLRLTSLYGFMKLYSMKRWFLFSLYLLSCFVCSFASVSSFHASVIREYENSVSDVLESQRKEVSVIKRAQAERMTKDLEGIEKDLNWCNVKLAKVPDSKYWKARRAQIEAKLSRTKSFYDSVLSYIPGQNAEEWIEREALKYEVERMDGKAQYGRAWAFAGAVEELWGLNEKDAKKVMGVFITAGVELGIFILALLSRVKGKAGGFSANGKVRELVRRFGLRSVRSFARCVADFYRENNELPKASMLSRRNREIRKFILDKLSDDELNELMRLDGR